MKYDNRVFEYGEYVNFVNLVNICVRISYVLLFLNINLNICGKRILWIKYVYINVENVYFKKVDCVINWWKF